MIPSAVRAIFFDAVGTLIHPDPPAIQVYAAVGRRFGSQLAIESIRQQFYASFKNQDQIDHASGFVTSESREVERWRSIVAATLPDVSNPDQAFAELFSHFAQLSSWRYDEDVPLVLAELARRGYLLGLASNFDSRLRSVVRGIQTLHLLEPIVISSEVGYRKPAHEFFDAVCRIVDLSPEQVLYVGDDWENDYEGAHKSGLEAILFTAQGVSGHVCSVIKKLGDLLE
jgi:putative hydrolase of the HAD superfamily